MRVYYGDLDLTDYPYSLQFGMDTGAPENASEALAFLLQDGEVELSDRSSNRTLQFTVLVEGTDLLDIAENEAALVAQSEKPRNTITVDPEDFGPPTVHETFRGQARHARDDAGEMSRLRSWTITAKAYPFPRSQDEVTSTALPASGTTTNLVNDGSSATNWTGAIDGTSTAPSVVSGAVMVSSVAAVTGTVTARLTYTASIATSSTPYLVIDWKPETPAGSPDLRAYGDGIELPLMAKYASPTAGFTRSYFQVAAASVAVLRLDSTSTSGSDPSSAPPRVRSLYVDNINRTDERPSFGSARQSIRAMDVAGSARAPGTLTVEHATNALGDAIVYSYPDGDAFDAYSPPLRQYRVGTTNVTTDATKVSGAYDNILAPNVSTYDIPLADLVPGSHLLVVRLALGGGTNPSVSWTAGTYINSTLVGSAQSGSFVPVAPAMTNIAAARMTLPLVDVDPAASNAVARITIGNASGAPSSGSLDEAWLFNTTVGQLTMVSCGTGAAASGGPAKRLFIEPPTTSRPRPSVRIGHAADKSDSFYPAGAVTAWQSPQFRPPRVRAFVVTSNATDPTITLKYFPRWHTNAAR